MRYLPLAILAIVPSCISACLPFSCPVIDVLVPSFGPGVTDEDRFYGDPKPFLEAALQPNASGTARPSVQVGRNSSKAHAFQVDSAPLYNWRLNVSNVSLSLTKGLVRNQSPGSNAINGVLELILPETEVDRLASENKTLEVKLLYTGPGVGEANQADDGSCSTIIEDPNTMFDLLVSFLAIDPYYRDDMPAGTENITNGSPYYGNPTGFNATANYLNTSLAPSGPGVSLQGYYGDDAEVKFLDYNGTASRAVVSHVTYGNSTAAYYRSLTQVLPIVVIERFLNSTDAVNGTEIASMACIRPKEVLSGSLPLPSEFWQQPEGALNVSSNVNNTQVGSESGTSAGHVEKASSMLAVAAAVMISLLLARA